MKYAALCVMLTLASQFVPASARAAQEPAPSPSQTPRDNAKPELRLMLARLELFTETGRHEDAYLLLGMMKAAYPNNPQVLLAEADLNERTNNRTAGRMALDRALALDPGNEDILSRRDNLAASQQPLVNGSLFRRENDQADETLTRAEGQVLVATDMTAGIAVENDHVDTKGAITRSNGATVPFNGDRQRATFTLNRMYGSGDVLTGALYAGNEIAGAGLAYDLWDASGRTRFEGNYQQPEWTFLESVIGHGTRDDLRVNREQHFSRNFQGSLGGGVNRYGLEDDEDTARSLVWDLNLGYSRPYSLSSEEDDEVTLGVYYTVEGEYFREVETRTTALGVAYRPFPGDSYEVHSLSLSASRQFTRTVYGEAFGGYAVDRLGGDGPIYGGRLEYKPTKKIACGFQFSSSLQGQRGSEETNVVGVYVSWRW